MDPSEQDLMLGPGVGTRYNGQFCAERIIDTLCDACKGGRGMFYDDQRGFGLPCPQCKSKILAPLLNQRGGSVVGPFHIKPLAREWGVTIDCARPGAFHRYYCKSCRNGLKDHVSLDTDQALFDHMQQNHGILVQYYITLSVNSDNSWIDHWGAGKVKINNFYIWKKAVEGVP